MPADEQWASAFAAQALADLDIRDILAEAGAPAFARLHFLQMAAEKLCKAYLVRNNGHEQLGYNHCLIAKQMPRVLEDVLRRTQGWRAERISLFVRQLRPVLMEIEFLSPACHAEVSRPDNTEYPWIDGSGTVQTPQLYPFSNLAVGNRQVTQLIKLMRTALQSFTQN